VCSCARQTAHAPDYPRPLRTCSHPRTAAPSQTLILRNLLMRRAYSSVDADTRGTGCLVLARHQESWRASVSLGNPEYFCRLRINPFAGAPFLKASVQWNRILFLIPHGPRFRWNCALFLFLILFLFLMGRSGGPAYYSYSSWVARSGGPASYFCVTGQ
jgi:hypothetical protein